MSLKNIKGYTYHSSKICEIINLVRSDDEFYREDFNPSQKLYKHEDNVKVILEILENNEIEELTNKEKNILIEGLTHLQNKKIDKFIVLSVGYFLLVIDNYKTE